MAGTSERLHILFHRNISVQKNYGCNVERLELFIKPSLPISEENFSETYPGECRHEREYFEGGYIGAIVT